MEGTLDFDPYNLNRGKLLTLIHGLNDCNPNGIIPPYFNEFFKAFFIPSLARWSETEMKKEAYLSRRGIMSWVITKLAKWL